MKEERMMILSMLEEGKITSEDAIKLLEALEESKIYEKEEDKGKLVDMDKTKEKMKEFENVIKEQGKKVEEIGTDLGNKLSNLFSNVKEVNPKVLLSGEELTETTLEKNISHIENPIIDFKSINGNISIENWKERYVSIKLSCQYKKDCLDKEEQFYDFYEEGNRLIFLPKISNNIKLNLKVYLPDKFYDEIHLSTSNGKIQAKDCNANKLQCNTKNASINIENIKSQEMLLKSTNGRIFLENINSKNIALSTTNGRILLDHIITDNISATTTNGSIRGENIDGKNINLTTSNGKITFKNIVSDKSKDIKLHNSNGAIEVEIENINKEYYFDLETSSGNIYLEIPNLIYKVNEQKNKVIAHSKNFNEELEHFKFTASTSNGPIKVWKED